MTTPPGWEPGPGPTRGDPARRAPRGAGGWAPGDADPRRQAPRNGTPGAGRERDAGPRFTPSRAPGQRDGAPPRAPRPGQGGSGQGGRGSGAAADRRGAIPDQFAARVRPAGESRPADRDLPVGVPANGIGGLQPGGLMRLMGSLGLWTALLLMAGAALIGVVLSLAAGKDPGMLLGFFVIVGSIAAVLGIRRNLVYLVFPAPALTLFVAAMLLGKIHDAKLSSSTAGLASGFAQWIAGIFVPAVLATVIVVVVGGGRWLLGRQFVTGTSRLVASSGRAGGDAAPTRTRRPAASDSWADDNPFEDPDARSPGTGPSPRQGSRPQPQFDGAPNGARPPRDQRPAPDQRPGRGQRPDSGRDQWGEPTRPVDRDRSLPPGNSRPPQSPGRPAQPRDRTGPRPQPPGGQQPGPSWSPNNQRPARPPRPQPPDGWTR